MVNEILTEYICTHTAAEPSYLKEITRRTEHRTVNPRMSSGHVQGRFLAILSRMLRPANILELGTFSGYSALCLAEGLQPEGRVITIEKNDELEAFIRSNLALTPLGTRVELRIGAAEDILPTLFSGSNQLFDIAYLDADKRRYIDDYELVLPLVRRGGLIIADNTLWDGHIADPAYSRDPQTQAIRKFNDYILKDSRVSHALLPLRDGLTLLLKQ